MNTPQTAEADSGKILVFITRHDAKCADCGEELLTGRRLRIENDQALCLDCADLGHLEYLPRGDTAVTRRATKYSPITAVVLQWARARKRYERQGILAAPEAIRRAEEECMADADLRALQRERAAVKRVVADREYLAQVVDELKRLFPFCPAKEVEEIANHACEKYSGRVGRSAAAKDFDPQALKLAVIAHIRHVHTRYDKLLSDTGDRRGARALIQKDIEKVLSKWEGRKS
ncbi:MAG TPA: DUF2293 domain-containing protein [Candidatus Limnocylindria bacterium]|nr:DUF2293 domain-containing protein [Candidatus Limnocylindria bacterium]